MFLILRILLAIILALLVQYADGNQRTVHVSDRSDDSSACCGPQYVNCSCNSLADALGYLGSNVLINITTDVNFSSLIKKSDLENVSIVGHSNPTVNCKNTAGIHLKFCYNCIIQGITWHGCGTKAKPGIKLSSSSNITIQNCSFQHSKGQAIVLSGAPGDVNIHHCNFVHNHYGDHGAAIHHLSSHVANKHSNLVVSYCNFVDNKHVRSLVYVENSISKHNNNITFQYSKFHHNQGDFSIYGKNCNIYINGKSSFLNNTAYVLCIKDHSNLIFSQNSEVNFIQNTGNSIFLTNYSSIIFDKNSVALFYNNLGTRGIIYSYSNSSIIFTATCEVTFKSNSARHDDHYSGSGGVIYSSTSYICFEGNASIVFSNNSVHYHGGGIYSHSSYISFKGNSSTVFNNNVAKWYGGGVYSEFSHISFEEIASVVFTYNTAIKGGAMYSSQDFVTFKGISYAMLSSNNAYAHGGAVYIYYEYYEFYANNFIFEENTSVMFSNNTSIIRDGGALYLYNSAISFKGNSSTVFSNNIASDGGAVYYRSYIDGRHISFEGNASTVFSNNVAKADGGAIYYRGNANGYNIISFEGNSCTTFSNNIAIGNYDSRNVYGATSGYGGAIYSKKSNQPNRYICFERNASTVFINNTAGRKGGALFLNKISICFKGNSSTMFSSNNANDSGGAIAALRVIITFEKFSNTALIHNAAKLNGGAIYSEHSFVSFKANSTTDFSNNTATNKGGAVNFKSGNISFEGRSVTSFSNNIADYGGALSGGAKFAADNSSINFCDNSVVNFTNNKATFGAIVFSEKHSRIILIENSTVIYNNMIPRWCNNICLLYPSDDDVVMIESNGKVWCSDNNGFICLTKHCHCKKLEDFFPPDVLKHNSLVNITDNVTLSSTILLGKLQNFSIIGHNITVFCFNGSLLSVYYGCRNIRVEGITWIGCGSYDISNNIDYSALHLYCDGILIQNCNFQYSIVSALTFYVKRENVNISYCNFMNNNNYVHHGSAIRCSSYNKIDYFDSYHDHWVLKNIQSTFMLHISNCDFSHNGYAKSILSFDYHYKNYNSITHIYLSNSNFQNNQGISVYLPHDNFNIHIVGEVLFENNVAESGAGLYINEKNSYVIFHRNSIVKFINNSVDHNGAAIFLNSHSSVTFEQNSNVTFNDNKATSGTIYSKANSNVTFKATCLVKFNGNSATQYGSAIHSFDNSQVVFKGKSSVTFSNNVVSSNVKDLWLGGTVFSENNGYVSFEENSFTLFSNNSADFGAAIFSLYNSSVTFKDQSKVMFNSNIAQRCGVMTSVVFSTISYNDHTIVTYNTNVASYTFTSNLEISAGIMCTFQRTNIIITGHSFIAFANNEAAGSGAMVLSESDITTEAYSTIMFKNNIAQYTSGGTFMCTKNSSVTIKGNSNVTFDSNKASQSGGAIHNMCQITFKDNSISTFINNTAKNNGGAIVCSQPSQVSFEGNTTVTFDGNIADDGGALYSANSTVIFKDAPTVLFYNNTARRSGGVGYFSLNSKMIIRGTTTVRFDNNTGEKNAGVLYCIRSNIIFKGNSTITLTHNRALDGGAFLADDHSNISLAENSVLLFVSNKAALSGGAGYFNSHCNFIIEGNVMVTFDNNRAYYGGAVCVNNNTGLTLQGYSTVFFCNNSATEGGGAVNVLNNSSMSLKDNTTAKFTKNSAQYGGAISLDTTAIMANNSYIQSAKFTNNIAKFSGNLVYQDVAELCNSSDCLTNRIIGMSKEFIATPPNELKFYDPAICIDHDNDTQCNNYYVKNIMLGREIVIPVCLLDYYNHSVESAHFSVQSKTYSNYFASGPKNTLISCQTFEGISVMGNQSLSRSENFSIIISLNTVLYSDWKQIVVNLTIELSPCYLGFWQYSKLEKCTCYNANDIVFCSDSSSTIKRGYWFGSIAGKPTVTFCPIDYCNFTCCETSNGYHHLSPVRENQCKSQRSGAACGSCTYGYTLSFDSSKCVNVESCTAGQTVLVILLIAIYWIVIIMLVFGMMYYKVKIGYLYSISYYYSILDIILNPNLQATRGLYLTVNIMSSFSKITPQFLGELCLLTGMSGIDQQFIHYIHPSAVILILVMISLLARKSPRISTIISRGIIHVICLLLLLSYTSVASTSLLLMRSLTFYEINKVYTYLSPDIEYFHGRHLPYSIVALLCAVTIVIGLPLLLTFEPILNHKLNFTRIKPLLDQFQGCYKDKYRCFAGYYMICRLVIIAIVIINSSNDFVVSYMLIIVCGLTDLIHVTVKPYSNDILNKFDGTILHLIIFIAALPLFDDFDSPLAITIAFVLVILPLVNFIAITLFMHRDYFKKIVTHYTSKNESPSNSDVNNNEIPMREFDHAIDNNMRINAAICDM